MLNKKQSRLKRARRFRAKNKILNIPRLVVFRSNKHIFAQLIDKKEGQDFVVAESSTKSKELAGKISGDKKAQAKLVGENVAIKALDKGISKVAFDRSGFLYHGRIQALADGARSKGLNF